MPVPGCRRDRFVVTGPAASRRMVRAAPSRTSSSPVRSLGRIPATSPRVELSTVSSSPSGTAADMQVSPNGSAVRNAFAKASSWRKVVVDCPAQLDFVDHPVSAVGDQRAVNRVSGPPDPVPPVQRFADQGVHRAHDDGGLVHVQPPLPLRLPRPAHHHVQRDLLGSAPGWPATGGPRRKPDQPGSAAAARTRAAVGVESGACVQPDATARPGRSRSCLSRLRASTTEGSPSARSAPDTHTAHTRPARPRLRPLHGRASLNYPSRFPLDTGFNVTGPRGARGRLTSTDAPSSSCDSGESTHGIARCPVAWSQP